MQKYPKISIITVTYNAEKYLEATIQSVLKQTYSNIEYLIIDGKSKDKTLEIIKKYENQITKWLSESDKGLYDAMNKGIDWATGDYLWFMNAGDEIFAANTLEKIFAKEQEGDIYYGDAQFLTLDKKEIGLRSEVTPHKLPEKLTWKSMQYGMVVCHQAVLVKKEIAQKYKSEKHPYSADIDWLIDCLKQAQKVVHTQQTLAIYLQGGFSRRHLKNSLLDRFKIFRKHFGFLPTFFNHFWIALRGFLFVLRKGKY